ncbi:hypothetical protein Dsin_024702 [Dipteronia sinensis]|uniref:Ribonuclease H1 N-terminal domain-containing protein n=1 Tax=Dipteronia sinensis TaxID=43782 RepID=A0AAD9ZUY6_9ROSI|nr:hypothetical protein Dsin_024702 [Dipteronia sinensis]
MRRYLNKKCKKESETTDFEQERENELENENKKLHQELELLKEKNETLKKKVQELSDINKKSEKKIAKVEGMAGSSKNVQKSFRFPASSINTEKLSIGSYTINYSHGVPFQPLKVLKDKLTKPQQALLNNIWFFRNDNKGFLNSLNILSQYFVENNKFSYYVVYKGRKVGIYSTWQETASYVEDFPNPIFKGFYSLEEANISLRLFLQNQDGFEPILEFNGITYDRNQVQSFMNHFKRINEAKNSTSEELEHCKATMNELLDKLQAENKVLKQKLDEAEQLTDQIQKLDIIDKKQKNSSKDKEIERDLTSGKRKTGRKKTAQQGENMHMNEEKDEYYQEGPVPEPAVRSEQAPWEQLIRGMSSLQTSVDSLKSTFTTKIRTVKDRCFSLDNGG